RIGAAIALSVGAVMTVGLFRLARLNAPHIYDPADPLGSARAGSFGDAFSQTIGDIRHGLTLGRGLVAAAIGTALIVIVVLVVASHRRVSLFEPGRARLAFDAVLARTGPAPLVLYVAVTPDEVLIEMPKGSGTTARIDWRADRRTLFGWSEWDDVSGPTERFP